MKPPTITHITLMSARPTITADFIFIRRETGEYPTLDETTHLSDLLETEETHTITLRDATRREEEVFP